MKEIITLEQAPVIIYNKMAEVSKKVQQRIAELNIEQLVATEDNVKSLKNIRAELNKEFAEFENQRKLIKEAVAKPYQEFEKQYKEFIQAHYNVADVSLKEKIFSVENQLRIEKENEVKEYFDELCQANQIDFLTFERLQIKVNLSTSMKSLKEEVSEKIKSVSNDVEYINSINESEAYKAEVFFEYKNSLQLTNALSVVAKREQARKEAQARAEAEARRKAEIEAQQAQQAEPQEEVEQKPEVLQAPQVTEQAQEEKIFELTFKVKGTMQQLKALKQFIINNNILIVE